MGQAWQPAYTNVVGFLAFCIQKPHATLGWGFFQAIAAVDHRGGCARRVDLDAQHPFVELVQDVRTWVGRALSFPGVRLKGLSPSIAIESTRLPGTPRRDPADRILIATARLIGATLVTCDEAILGYAADGYVRVLDARPRR